MSEANADGKKLLRYIFFDEIIDKKKVSQKAGDKKGEKRKMKSKSTQTKIETNDKCIQVSDNDEQYDII